MNSGLTLLVGKYKNSIYTLLAITFSFIFYQPYLNTLPLGVHNWAQSDRYSVAVKFLEHNDILKARTHNLGSVDGRCGVEFPLVQFIAAKLANVFGENSLPMLFKVLNFSILFFGFIYFIFQWQGNWLINRIIGSSILFSPMLFFYAYNFLPDTAGLGFLLFSFGFFVKYYHNKHQKDFTFSLIFAGLATLVKTTCGISLLAMLGAYFLYFLKKKDLKRIASTVVHGIILLSVIYIYDYFFFHKVNEDFYSRVFMSVNHPIESLHDLNNVLKGLLYWFGQYLTIPQLFLLVTLIILYVITPKSNVSKLLPTLFIGIYLIGLLAFLGLMGKQFINHDYYFIASFTPIFVFMLWAFSRKLATSSSQNKWLLLVVSGLTLVTITLTVSTYTERMQSHFLWKNRDIITDIEWMQNGDYLLDDLGIKQSDRLFVCYEPAPNTSLVYFNRDGKVFNHEEMSRDSANMKYWSERIQPEYYIVPSIWVNRLSSDQPWLYSRLVLFAKRPNFYIYKPID